MLATEFNVHKVFAQYFAQDELQTWLKLLSEAMDKGNVCLDLKMAKEENMELVEGVLESYPLVGKPGAILPFILFKGKLYLQRFFEYENRFVNNIKAIISQENAEAEFEKLKTRADFISNQLFKGNNKLQAIDWQKIACINSFVNRFSIISGGPGTGKTTTVTKLLALFLMDNENLKIKICAPTGKAAARLAESISKARQQFEGIAIDEKVLENIIKIKPKTIHSTLGYIHNSIHFFHNSSNPLDADILLVDECSMIDMSLFYKLMAAVDSKRTRVILLGDKNQLASVDAGSVFRDLCSDTAELNKFSANRVAQLNQFIENDIQKLSVKERSAIESHALSGHIIELQTSYRFNDEEGIGKLSKAVLENNVEVLDSFFENNDELVKIFAPSQLEDCVRHFSNLLLEKNGGYIGMKSSSEILQKISRSSVLCAIKSGNSGVYAINKAIVQQVFDSSEEFFVNQLLMVTKNQAAQEIFNGDMGVMIDTENGLEVVIQKSETETIQLAPAQILAKETAFAMTIHKSQGSEFDEVLIVLPELSENMLLSRELLYTAITRAKKKVSIIGTKEMILSIADKTVMRVSGIKDQF